MTPKRSAGSDADHVTDRSQRKTLSREAWLEAARQVLETSGIAAVKIDPLARQLRVTRGSFYFHFSGLDDLHDGLAGIWRQRNCAPFVALKKVTMAGREFFETVVRVWVDETTFSPALDMAVRDWARGAPQLAAEMKAADELRIALLTRSFRDMGYDRDESVVRARITYLHQIGYYAVGFSEPVAERKHYQPIYGRVLEGPLAG